MSHDDPKPVSPRDIVHPDAQSPVEPTSAAAVDRARMPTAGPVTPAFNDPANDMLFPNEETTGYRSRWEAIQTGFVDEPRAAVEQADALVGQVVNRLADVFSRERETLEQQWGRGDNVSTEDLRVALKRYRAFFDRLLSV